MEDTSFRKIDIDQVRNFWNQRPCNIKHSKKPIGSKKYFDEVEARKYFVEPNLPIFANFPATKNLKVLEVGCGIGTITMGFARAGAEVCAIDLSDYSLTLAKKRAKLYGFQNQIQFYHANAEVLSETLPKKEYDLIFSFGVLHHTPNPENAFSELYHYLKPGGQLKIMVYHRHSWKVFEILLKYGKCQFWKLRKLIATYSEAQTGCPVTYSYTKKEIKKLLEKHNFKIEKIEIDHIFPYRISDYVNYKYVKTWYFRFLPSFIFRALEKRFGWHLCITAKK